MNIAVCISGTMRNISRIKESIKLIKQTGEVKIFAHIWNIADECEETLTHNPNLDIKDPSSLVNELDLTDYLLEKFVDYLPLFKENKKILCTKQEGFNTSIIHGMWCSISKVNQIKKNYETNHNLKFDIVYRTRFDSLIKQPNLPTSTVKPNTVYIPYGYDCLGINDQFAYGDSETMSKYCSLYENLTEINNITNYIYNSEQMLQVYLNKVCQLEIERVPLTVLIHENV